MRFSDLGNIKTVADHPELVKQWHPEKNGDLTPDKVVAGSNKKYWWKCYVGPDHEWKSSANARTGKNKRGCTFCRGLAASVTNSLASLYPDIAKEWHPEKNGDLTPDKVVAGSHKKYWWKCAKGPDHEWYGKVVNRTRSRGGCEFCLGRKVSVTNSLASLYPDIAKEWHPEKNGDLTPDKVVAGSHKKYWWKCAKGPDHEWITTVSKRTFSKTNCRACEGLAVSVTNSLASLYPNIAKEWHPEKNGDLTPDKVVAESNKRYWWKCVKGADHEWITSPNNRVSKKSSCACCTGQQVSVTNSLASLYPDIAKEWHPTLNRGLTPDKVVARSNKNYWWLCLKNKGHDTWPASPGNRTANAGNGTGCPDCDLKPKSKEEIKWASEINYLIKFNLFDDKVKCDEKNFNVDVKIPKFGLILEYDGSYWHLKNHCKDKDKSKLLRQFGWKVIRIRQKPLTSTHDDDVLFERNESLKIIADLTFKQIEKVCNIKIKGLDKYLRKNNVQNSRKADKYIQKLLTEKS